MARLHYHTLYVPIYKNNHMLPLKWLLVAGLGLAVVLFSCTKSTADAGQNPVNGNKLLYADSILYRQPSPADYIVYPISSQLPGTYSGFPEGIDIDAGTGAINVSKSESGLRYRVSFHPNGSSDSSSTLVVISGINFLDGFYRLNSPDSVARPTYNGSRSPVAGVGTGSVFDENRNCNANGCSVDVGSGVINLAQTVRNGIFGTVPANNDRHEFEYDYRLNDKSGKSLNTLRVKLYYFQTMNDVTQEAYDILSSREGTLLRAASVAPAAAFFPGSVLSSPDLAGLRTSGINKPAKPRPPCIFIVAR